MQLQFVERNDGPERLVCDAEIVFDEDGPLSGMKLIGFALWRGADGEVYVTFPSRPSGSGSERRFYDYVRPHGGTVADSRRVKAWILEQYRARARDGGPKAASPAPSTRSRPSSSPGLPSAS